MEGAQNVKYCRAQKSCSTAKWNLFFTTSVKEIRCEDIKALLVIILQYIGGGYKEVFVDTLYVYC